MKMVKCQFEKRPYPVKTITTITQSTKKNDKSIKRTSDMLNTFGRLQANGFSHIPSTSSPMIPIPMPMTALEQNNIL